MFYNIKIKSSQSEYSLQSADRDIIQREMDLYFASLFGASREFVDKILKLEFKHTNDASSAIKNNIKTYNIDSNVLQNTIKTESQTKSSDIKQISTNKDYEKHIEPAANSNKQIVEDNSKDRPLLNNLQLNEIVIGNNIDSISSQNTKTGMLEFEKDNNQYQKEMTNHNEYSAETVINLINNEPKIEVKEYNDSTVCNINVQKQSPENSNNNDITFTNQNNSQNNLSSTGSTITKDKIVESKSKNTEETYILPDCSHINTTDSSDKTTNNNFDNTSDTDSINTNSQNINFEISKKIEEKAESYDILEQYKQKITKELQKEFGIRELQNIKEEKIENNTYNQNDNSFSVNESLNFETSTNVNSNDFEKQDYRQESNYVQIDSDNQSDNTFNSINENINAEEIIKQTESNVNSTDINVEHNDEENLLDIFNDVDVSRNVFSEVKNNSDYKMTEIKNQDITNKDNYKVSQELLDKAFANTATESYNCNSNSSKQATGDANINTLSFDANQDDSDNTTIEISSYDSTYNLNYNSDSAINIQNNIQNTYTQTQTANYGSSLDFGLYRAQYIIQDTSDDFIICAYYIKNILRQPSFTMKFINSKIFNATEKIADMSILNNFIAKGIIKETTTPNSSKQYTITNEGEMYFITKFQS